MNDRLKALIEHIHTRSVASSERLLVAIAGVPAVGKTTLARQLAQALPNCSRVSMDGFHLDNQILKDLDLIDRKGAPETFDLDGFVALLNRLKTRSAIYVPDFDRATERSINCAQWIPDHHDILVVEGNYLLLDETGWRELQSYWDISIFLTADLSVIEQRLIDRWLSFGFSDQEAHQKAHLNDIPNAKRILDHALAADWVLQTDEPSTESSTSDASRPFGNHNIVKQ